MITTMWLNVLLDDGEPCRRVVECMRYPISNVVVAVVPREMNDSALVILSPKTAFATLVTWVNSASKTKLEMMRPLERLVS